MDVDEAKREFDRTRGLDADRGWISGPPSEQGAPAMDVDGAKREFDRTSGLDAGAIQPPSEPMPMPKDLEEVGL